MVWIFLAPICFIFPVWITNLGKVKTWFENIWRDAMETQPENLMLFYSTNQGVLAIIVNRFLEKFLWPFFSLRLYIQSQILFPKSASPECCQTFHKYDFQDSPKYTKWKHSIEYFFSCIILYWINFIFKQNVWTQWNNIAISVTQYEHTKNKRKHKYKITH